MDISNKNYQIINNIEKLQTIEKNLLQNLENNVSNNSLSKDQINILVKQINDVSEARSDLYKTLTTTNTFYQSNMKNTNITLDNQTDALIIIEAELNASKKRLQFIEEEKINKLRLVEINNYYSDRYNENSKAMIVLIITFSIILLFSLLRKFGILPAGLYALFVIIVSVVGGILLIKIFINASKRDNMNYQEYTWQFDPNTAPGVKQNNGGTTTDPWASPINASLICVGQQCCYTGSTWNSEQNVCIPDINAYVEKELTKGSTQFKKADVTLGNINMSDAQ